MENNTTTVNANLEAITTGFQMMNANMRDSIERMLKLSSNVTALAFEQAALEADDYDLFQGQPEQVLLAKESVNDRLALATAKARRAILWVQSNIKNETGKSFIIGFLPENIETVVRFCSALQEQINVMLNDK